MLAETHKAAESVIEAFMGLKANILVQEFIKEAGGADIRCFVIGDKVVAAMKRQGKEGEFRFDTAVAAPRQTIQKSNTSLLMEAARRLDEWRVLSRKIPSVDLVPEFVILENREGQINLNTMEWLLLSKIDGERSQCEAAFSRSLGGCEHLQLLLNLLWPQPETG